jgi:hypothetical protein
VIAARIDELFGVGLDLRVFVANPTVAMLSELIRQRRSPGHSEALPPLRRAVRMGPLSAAQRRMCQPVGERDTRWNVAVPFAIRGPLDVGALRRSVAELMRRHEILTEEMQRPFDLEAGPLFRLVLLRLGEREHRLIRATHHLIHDAVSWQIFFDELAVAYTALVSGAASPLGPAPALQYLDYAAWERELIRPESPLFKAAVDWSEKLESPLEPVSLPFAKAEPDRSLRDLHSVSSLP